MGYTYHIPTLGNPFNDDVLEWVPSEVEVVMEKVKEMFPTKTFKTIINRSSHLQEAPMHGKSVLEFAFNSRGSKEYRALAKEIINNNTVVEG